MQELTDVRYTRSSSFVTRNYGNTCLLVPLSGSLESVLTLNRTGKVLWDTLESPCTERDMVLALLRIFPDELTVRADVASFIRTLQAMGLVQEAR